MRGSLSTTADRARPHWIHRPRPGRPNQAYAIGPPNASGTQMGTVILMVVVF